MQGMLSGICRNVARTISSAGIAQRFVATPRSFATYKSSTGLVGLSVDPNGRETLQDLASQVLENVKVKCHLSLFL
jgi:hypothetical protein